MGEVYRARDTKLGRDVALKILPDSFTHDAERLARFRREAQVLASLNHPHIAQIYALGESKGTQFLILELVDGESLDRRLARGPMRIAEALAVGKQVAAGLQAAHDKGVVHRDLKPANIVVTSSGQVKVVDFGLAKNTLASALDMTNSPTITVAHTEKGVILGTAPYMSPEQARGYVADKRSDVWAFGCVLYEMLTGRKAFPGATFSDAVASILGREPDWQALPRATPTSIRELLRRCLQKDPTRRLQDIGDARILIEETEDASAQGAHRSLARRSAPLVGSLMLIAVAVGALVLARWPVAMPPLPQLMPFATDADVQTMARWSPQGDRLAYVAATESGLQVFTKSPGSAVATQITHEPDGCLNPMWSPDATRIYYLTSTRSRSSLRSIAVAGGPSQLVLDHVVQADVSPDGRTLAAVVFDLNGRNRLILSSPPGANPRPFPHSPFAEPRSSGQPTYLRFDSSGKWLGAFSLGSRVEFWKIPLDGGVPKEMLHGLGGLLIGHFTWLANGAGVVTDVTGTAQQSLHLWTINWTSQTTRAITAGPARESFPSLSPDGRTLALTSGELGFDIIEVPVDGSAVHDVIATARQEIAPSWAPDGVHFAYITDRSGGTPEIWLRNRQDGSERRIVGSKELPEATYFQDCAVSPDGTHVAYRVHAKDAEPAIWISPLTGDVPVKLWDDPLRSAQRGPSWSPDGNWIAYSGFHDGKAAVMKIRVGANTPGELVANMASLQMVRWSPRGDWILFRDGDALRIVSPDGHQTRLLSRRVWETYGWSKAGTTVYAIAAGDRHRLILGAIDVATTSERQVADLGPVPAAFDLSQTFNEFSYRGFSLHPDGTSFLTSVLRAKMQVYLIPDFDRTARLADRWWLR